jgi:hypothetical protein
MRKGEIGEGVGRRVCDRDLNVKWAIKWSDLDEEDALSRVPRLTRKQQWIGTRKW